MLYQRAVLWGLVQVGLTRTSRGVPRSPHSPASGTAAPGLAGDHTPGEDVSGWVVLSLARCPVGTGGGRAGSRSGKVALAWEEVDPPPLPKAWDENSFFLFTLPGPSPFLQVPPPAGTIRPPH